VCYNAARRKFEEKFSEHVKGLGIEIPADMLKSRKGTPKKASKKDDGSQDDSSNDDEPTPSNQAIKTPGRRKTNARVKKGHLTDDEATPSKPTRKAARGKDGKQVKGTPNSKGNSVEENAENDLALDSNFMVQPDATIFVQEEEAVLKQLASTTEDGELAFNYPNHEEVFDL
jgi:hypothetical protein